MQTPVLNSPSTMTDFKATLERIKIAESLHQAIRSGDISSIEKIPIEEHDSMNGFMYKGESPLIVALEVKEFRIVSNLLSCGIPLDKECMKLLDKLSDSEKNEIGSYNLHSAALRAKNFKLHAHLLSCGIPLSKKCRMTLAQLPESEKNEIGYYNLLAAKGLRKVNIYYILSIVRASSRSNRIDEKKSSAIEELFISLDNIKSIQPLLKAVRFIGQLEITFDCNNENIQCIWPLSDAEGLTLAQRKKILIAARGSYTESSGFVFDDADAARGTIIHEITHFIMENFYENSGKPYYKRDKVRARIFKQLTAKFVINCQRNFSSFEDPIFVNIFDSYERKDWESELIARVPEVMAKYVESKTRLEFMQKRAGKLIQFFHETLKHIDSFGKSEWSIRELNRSLKVHKKLVNSEISFKESFKNKEIPSDIRVISSNAPLFCMAHILNNFQSSLKFEVDSRVISAKFETFEEKVWDVVNAFYSSDKTVLVVDCENISNEKIVEALSFLERAHMCRRIIFVTDVKLADELQNQLENVKYENRNYKWDDLEYSTQERILEKSVEFQNGNKKIKLSDILTATSEACKFLPLQETFTDHLIIDKSLNASYEGFYLPRSFEIGQNQNKNYKTIWEDIEYDELYQKKNLGKLLISDIAGTGKTVIIERLAISLKDFYPTLWVNLVDLKNFTNELKQVEKSCKSLSFLHLFEKVFKKDITDLEREVLKKLYNKGKLIVLFDSFDEISPDFKEIAKVIIEEFELRDGNQLWVATRPHLENELKSEFGFTVVRLKELTRKSQVDFLMQSWERTDEESEKKANKLIDRLQNLIQSGSGYVGYPMLMKMIADIRSEDYLGNNEDFSYYFIYDNFFKKHIRNWGSGSKLAEAERDELECSDAQRCSKVHQILAIKSIFVLDFAEEDLKVDDEWSDEKILRVRIVKLINTENYKFIHETFVEYFVSVFIKNSITRPGNKDFDNVVQIIKNVILKSGHRIIRSFLNENLRDTTVSHTAREKINAMVRGLSSDELEKFLQYIVKENLIVILDLFEFHKFDSKIIYNLLRGSDVNYVYFSFSHNSGALLRCLIRSLKVLSNEDQRSLLYGPGTMSNVYHRLLRNPYGITREALEYLESVYSKKKIKAMLLKSMPNDWSCVLKKPIEYETSESSSYVKNSCNLFKKYLSSDQIISHLFGDRIISTNCLHSAAEFGNKFAINSIFEFAEELFGRNSEELRNILKSDDDYGETLLIMNLKKNKHECSYEALRSNLSRNGYSDNEINQQLTDVPRGIVIRCLVDSHRKERTLSKVLRLFLPETQFRLINGCMNEIIKKKRKYSYDSIKLDFFVKKHSELWEEFGSRIPKNEIKNLMMNFDFCSYAIRYFNTNLYKTYMENLFLTLKKYLNENEVIELLLRDDGKNVITNITCELSSGKVETFFEIMQKFGSDLSRKLLLSSDVMGNNIFHASTRLSFFWAQTNFSTVMCLMKKRFEVEEIKSLILASNKKNESVFHLIFEQFYDVEEQLAEVLDREEIRNLIMNEDNYELKLVRCLDTESYRTFAEKFSVLKKYFSNEEIINFLLIANERGIALWKLFLAVDEGGSNVSHNSASERDLIEFATVFRLGLDEETERKLLISIDENNDSILFYARDNFHEIVEQISAVLSKDDIKNLILHEFKNIVKSNWEHVLKPKSEPFSKKISCLEEYFTHGELVDLLLKESKYGANMMQLLCRCKNESNIRNIFGMTKKFGHKLSWKLFSGVDQSGRNIFFYSAWSQFPEAFPIVLRLMKESFGSDEVRKLLLIRNNRGESVFYCLIQNLFLRHSNLRQKKFYANKYLEIMSNEICIKELKQMMFTKTKSIFGDSCIRIMREQNYRSTFEKLSELGINMNDDEMLTELSI